MQMLKRNYAAPIGERLIIEKNKVRTEIPYRYSLEGIGDIKRRVKVESNAYTHGSTISGDGKIDSKKITLGIDVYETTEEEHDKIANELYSFFGQNDYTLITGRNDRVYNIACLEQSKHKFIKGFKQRRSEFDFVLLLADPFRYATQATVKRFVFTEKQEQTKITLLNKGSIDTPLSIEFIPTITMSDISIKHVESNKSFKLRDSLLTNPATLLVDTKEGTVRRGTYNAINAFSGQFLTALQGENNYLIDCDSGEIIITYTERWLI